MLGIVIVTHGALSEGLQDAAQVIMGHVENCQAVKLLPGMRIDGLGEEIYKAIDATDQGDGVVVMVDLFHASPYNQSVLAVSRLEEARQKKVFILGGANLPMLLETINQQLLEAPIEEVVEAVLQQGRASVESWSIDQMPQLGDDEEDDF